ncbi:hypothetical protein BD413DRAFT_119713 [Trametes elegans]|nr:hypothetical protein BD413DRAFT_119713 [Trametes elegans]
MSSGAGSSADQQLVAVYDSLFVNNCCGIATTVLLAYEYLVTFDREVNLFWRRRFTGASVLFLLNRYLPLSVTILEACGFIKMSDRLLDVDICGTNAVSTAIPPLGSDGCSSCVCPQRPPVADLDHHLAAHACASGYQHCRLLVPTLGERSGIRMRSISRPTCGLDGAMYVYTTRGRSSAAHTIISCLVSIAVRSCLIAGDCLVLVVTWHATYRTVRLHLASSGGASFTTTILRDGTVYFLVLLILNVLHLSFNTLSVCIWSPTTHPSSCERRLQFGNDALTSVSYVTIFTDPITAVLWNRLLMNLQQVNQSIVVDQDSNTVMSTFPGETTLSFARVIGSFGSSVMLSAVEEEEERVIGDSNTAVKQGDEGGRGGLGIEMASIEH